MSVMLTVSAAAQTIARGDLTPASFQAFSPKSSDIRVSDFSGLPVPRYSSLRHEDVNGRAGPGLDHPVVWRYHRLGLPVVVIRESREWRKIRDPSGDEVWVHRRLLGGERTAITRERGALRAEPDAYGAPLANFGLGVVMTLHECKGGWCDVEAGALRGWVRTSNIWGADPLEAAPTH
ncbi:hypothetical protein GC169_10075 [bacterium]|nr:hypothetical protein [bacterium]